MRVHLQYHEIYMIVDVNSPLFRESINRNDPVGSYTASYLNRTLGVVENFTNFPNAVVFFVVKEVINNQSTMGSNPGYIKVKLPLLSQLVGRYTEQVVTNRRL
jgi:hypothetical protein